MGIFGATIAPSAIPLTLGDGYLERAVSRLVFPAPREMTGADIQRVTRCFVDAARVMADAGFSGVELHGAHGYLVGMSFFSSWAYNLIVLAELTV